MSSDPIWSPAMIVVRWYKQNPLGAINGVIKFQCMLTAVGLLYSHMVNQHLIKSVDQLSEFEKRKLWSYVSHLDMEKRRKIEVCKAIYALQEASKIVSD